MRARNSLVGKAAELDLASQLLLRGSVPLWPISDHSSYDLALERARRTIRLQVKSSTQRGVWVPISTNGLFKGRTERYMADSVDIIAVKLYYYDLWYFIPTEMVKNKTIRIAPEREDCKWKKYREAWYLLGF